MKVFIIFLDSYQTCFIDKPAAALYDNNRSGLQGSEILSRIQFCKPHAKGRMDNIMPVMDEFKEERDAVKHGTPKQKLAYFLDYYKWYVIGGVIALICVASLISQIASHKDTAFYAMLLGAAPYSYPEEPESPLDFAAYIGADTEKSEVIYDTSVQLGTGSDYYAAQQILVRVSAAEVDVMASDVSLLLQYAYLGDFYDLRELLTKEQLEKYRNSFYYIDGAVLAEAEAARKDYEHEYVPDYGDPLHPEDMEDPIPAGILLKEDCSLLQDYSFPGDIPAVSVLINAPHADIAPGFIDYLMQ